MKKKEIVTRHDFNVLKNKVDTLRYRLNRITCEYQVRDRVEYENFFDDDLRTGVISDINYETMEFKILPDDKSYLENVGYNYIIKKLEEPMKPQHEVRVKIPFSMFLKNEQACQAYGITPEYVSQELKDLKIEVPLSHDEAVRLGFLK